MTLTDHAYFLLKSNPRYRADARRYTAFSNTIVGSVMAFTTGKPRWATEEAVKSALKRMRNERRKQPPPLR